MDNSNKENLKNWDTLQHHGTQTGGSASTPDINSTPKANQVPNLETTPLNTTQQPNTAIPNTPQPSATSSDIPKPTIASSDTAPKPTAADLGFSKTTETSPHASEKPKIQFFGPQLSSNHSTHSSISALASMANMISSNNQSSAQNNQPSNEPNAPQQASSNTDDELLKAFIGKNYEKIVNGQFSIVGFFIPTLYMFYRKMFAYALIAFLANLLVIILAATLIKIPIPALVLNILSGLFVNKLYILHAKQKITKIKAANSQKSLEELKAICITKGGTSIGQAVAGFFIEVGICIIALVVIMLIGINTYMGEILDPNNPNSLISLVIEKERQKDEQKGTLVENVNVSGYTCKNSLCKVILTDSEGNSTTYGLNIDSELFKILNDYNNYIKLDIYYEQKEDNKNIIDYKLFLKSNNEDITNVKTEDELRDKIGLYSVGTHTGTFTLASIGLNGAIGTGDGNSETYKEYTFTDDKNIEYEMKYINGVLDVVEGNKYTVTFEVTKGDFGYDFIIKSIE